MNGTRLWGEVVLIVSIQNSPLWCEELVITSIFSRIFVRRDLLKEIDYREGCQSFYLPIFGALRHSPVKIFSFGQHAIYDN